MNKNASNITKIGSFLTLFATFGFNLIDGDKSYALNVTLLPEDYGFFDSNGFHSSRSQNYYSGSCEGTVTSNNVPICPAGLGDEIRNFTLFDTSAISGNINSATLSLQNPSINVNKNNGLYPNPSILNGFTSVDPSENYQLRRYSGNTNLLTKNSASGSASGIGVFNNLGSGAVYGNKILTNADNGSIVDIDLNASAISQILSNGKFATGGTITTLGAGNNLTEFAFAFTNPQFKSIGTGAVSNKPITLNLEANEIAINTENRGFYSETGVFIPNNNYIAGDCRGNIGQCAPEDFIDGTDLGTEQRNIFSINLKALDKIEGDYDVFLKLFIPDTFTYGNGTEGNGFASGSGSENYRLADVITPVDQLFIQDKNGGEPGITIFNDLGSDNIPPFNFYSEEFTITDADRGSSIEVALNLDALQDIIDSFGSNFLIGGAITTLNNNVNPSADDEFAFGGTAKAFGLAGLDAVQLIFRKNTTGNSLSSQLPVTAGAYLSAVGSANSGDVVNPDSILATGLTELEIAAVNAEVADASVSTPEPNSLIGLASLGVLGLLSRKKKSYNS